MCSARLLRLSHLDVSLNLSGNHQTCNCTIMATIGNIEKRFPGFSMIFHCQHVLDPRMRQDEARVLLDKKRAPLTPPLGGSCTLPVRCQMTSRQEAEKVTRHANWANWIQQMAVMLKCYRNLSKIRAPWSFIAAFFRVLLWKGPGMETLQVRSHHIRLKYSLADGSWQVFRGGACPNLYLGFHSPKVANQVQCWWMLMKSSWPYCPCFPRCEISTCRELKWRRMRCQ